MENGVLSTWGRGTNKALPKDSAILQMKNLTPTKNNTIQ